MGDRGWLTVTYPAPPLKRLNPPRLGDSPRKSWATYGAWQVAFGFLQVWC